MFAGCEGASDENALPRLEVSSDEIDLADGVGVELTVIFDGEDVTADSEIFMDGSKTPMEGNVFTPVKEGTYTFVAEYDYMDSNEVTVRVADTRVKVESKYERHVSVMEFTGGWCINCPHGYDLMKAKLSGSMKIYADRIHICAFHTDVEGRDDFALDATQKVKGRMDPMMGYPSYATDLRDAGLLVDDQIHLFVPSIMTSFEESQTHCGVAVASVINADKSKATVTLKVTSEMTSDYRTMILVVEDKIKGYQKSNEFPDGKEDYIHSHVVRKVVTEYNNSFCAEKITADGKINAGDEASKTWEVAVDDVWKLADTEVYALVIDAEGHVNNMNVCAIDGGDSGYNLKNN